MKKFIIVFLLLLAPFCFAAEQIVDFEENSVPVLNELLRKSGKSIYNLEQRPRVLLWYISGTLVAGTDASARIILPFNGKIIKASAYATTAPTGATVIIDMNLNGTTLWASGKLTIAISANAATDKTVFDTTTVSTDDYLTVDIDQIGSTVAGADLAIQLHITETF